VGDAPLKRDDPVLAEWVVVARRQGTSRPQARTAKAARRDGHCVGYSVTRDSAALVMGHSQSRNWVGKPTSARSPGRSAIPRCWPASELVYATTRPCPAQDRATAPQECVARATCMGMTQRNPTARGPSKP
jgi:hypothetical protein